MSFLWNRRTLKRISPPGGKFSDSDLDHSKIFDDDYVHKNHLTVNYAGKGLNFATKTKATVDLKGASLAKAEPKTSFSTKIVTQVSDSAVETKLDNKGTVRLWADLGTYDFGTPIGVTGKLKTNNVFDRLSWAVQLQGRHGDVKTWNRVHIKNNGHLFWNAKAEYERGNILAGLVTKLSTSTFLLSKFTVYGAYEVNKNATVFAEYANRGNGLKSDPTDSSIIIASRLKSGNQQYGVKVDYNLLNKADPLAVQLGVVSRVNNDTTVRAKIDNKTNLAISAKHVRSSNLTVQVGTAVTLNNTASFTTNKLVPVPIGVSLNLSYA